MPFGGSRLRRCLDAPLAHSIGTPAKRATEIGAPRLKHPFARVFPRLSPLRRWRTQSGAMRTPSIGNRKTWRYRGHQYFWRPLPALARLLLALIYTDAYTFGFENWLISVGFPNARQRLRFGRLISAISMVVSSHSKFRSERSAGSIPAARTIPLGMIQLRHRTVAGSCQSGVWRPERAAPRFRRNDNRTVLSCWPLESRTGFGHRPIRLREASP